MKPEEDSLDVHDAIRLFGWSLIEVHLERLERIMEQGGSDPRMLRTIIRHLGDLIDNGPNDPDFVEWCHEALEYTTMLQSAMERPKLTVIRGGGDDGSQEE
jgi:hypothetical protein